MTMIDPDKIPSLLKKVGEMAERRFTDAVGKKESDEPDATPSKWPPMRNESMEHMEPDWDEIDKKANLIVARYSVVSAAMNILPMPFDVMGVTGTFAKMATELAGVYQVIVSNKRARQMGWAIASSTASVLGLTYAGAKLAKLLPGGYWIATAVQAPLVGAVAWAAGDSLKEYFKQCRQGKEPGISALSESFANRLRLKLKEAKVPAPGAKGANGAAPVVAATKPAEPVADAVEKLASLHELLRAGAITQEEYDAKKAELLAKI